MRTEILRKRLEDLEAQNHRGRIPTTVQDGQRVWLKVGGSGLSFLRLLTKALRDNDVPSELRQQCDLWSRAEVDDPGFSEIARMNRTQARRAMGEE
jgi:hypothetical protein